MVPTSSFSGFASSACALASAAAIAPIVSLDRCMTILPGQKIEADRARLRPFGPDPMAKGLLRVLRHQPLELDLGLLMLEKGLSCRAEHPSKVRPGVRAAHVYDLDRRYHRSWRLDPKWPRNLARLDAMPEPSLGGYEEMLIKRVGIDSDFDPFAAPGDDRQRRGLRVRHPHVVLQLRPVLFGRSLFRKCPWQHELGLEHFVRAFDHAVEGGGHPAVGGVTNAPLDICDDLFGISLEPNSIEAFGRDAELDDQIVG